MKKPTFILLFLWVFALFTVLPNNRKDNPLSFTPTFTEDEYTESLIIDNAEVYVAYNGINYLLPPVNGSLGSYSNLDSNLVISGASYNLSFEYNGTLVSATTTIPSKPVFSNR